MLSFSFPEFVDRVLKFCVVRELSSSEIFEISKSFFVVYIFSRLILCVSRNVNIQNAQITVTTGHHFGEPDQCHQVHHSLCDCDRVGKSS